MLSERLRWLIDKIEDKTLRELILWELDSNEVRAPSVVQIVMIPPLSTPTGAVTAYAAPFAFYCGDDAVSGDWIGTRLVPSTKS